MKADLPTATPAAALAIAGRTACAESFREPLFPTTMPGDDRTIAAVWMVGAPHLTSCVIPPKEYIPPMTWAVE